MKTFDIYIERTVKETCKVQIKAVDRDEAIQNLNSKLAAQNLESLFKPDSYSISYNVIKETN